MKRSRILAAVAALVTILVLASVAIPWERFPVLNRVLDSAENSLSKPLLRLGHVSVSPAFLIKAVVFILLLALVARKSRRFFRTYLLDRLTMTEGHKYALETAAEYVIIIAGLAVGLQSAGIDLSSLALVGGALGIGVGFGLQSIVSNFVSGLVLLFEGPVKVGDRVQVADLNGDVVKIGARSTWVRTNENIIVVMPNSEFITKPVVNWTATDRQVRFSLPVGVSYDCDPEEVRAVLLGVAGENPDILPIPAPDVVFVGFGDSSLNFELRVWTVVQVQTPSILKSDLYFAVFRAFKEHGIEIPFPQRDLHLRTAPALLPNSGSKGQSSEISGAPVQTN
jgi:small-conductance mechanosensitive channel